MSKLDRSWAESQIEAMADGSLSPEAEQRMRSLIDADPEIGARVARARSLRRELGALRGGPVPRGLLGRLWQIPAAGRPKRPAFMPAAAFAALAAAALAVSLFMSIRGPTAEELAREAAVQDFVVAMAYLQKSVTIAQNEVNQAVGSGMLSAIEVSREVMEASPGSGDEGEQEDVD